MKLSKEVLKLKCAALHLLSDGTRRDLAERLHDHFNPPQLPPPPPPVDIGDVDDDRTENGVDDDGTFPYDGTVTDVTTNTTVVAPTPAVGITEDRMLAMIQNVVESSVREVHSHVKALHSQVVHLQQQTKLARAQPMSVSTSTTQLSSSATVTTSTTTTTTSSGNNNVFTGDVGPAFAGSHTTTTRTGMLQSDLSLSPAVMSPTQQQQPGGRKPKPRPIITGK